MKCAALITLVCSLLLCSCGRSEAEKLYSGAREHEQQDPFASIESYRRVVAADPESPWAKKAQARINEIQAKRATSTGGLNADQADFRAGRPQLRR